jgi:nicotinamide-nucleotide amidase
MPSPLVIQCAELLKEKNLTIVFAESATAGRLCYEFSLIEKAGKFLKGSLVTYSADLKQDNLRVKGSLIEKYSPESAEVTAAMTAGMITLFPADIYISVTGLLQPGGSESEEKPVGTVFIHGRYDGQDYLERIVFKGGPEEIVLQTVDRVAFLVSRTIQ